MRVRMEGVTMRKTPRTLGAMAAAIVALATFAASPARAEDPAQCDAQHELDKYQLLRRLSLDLRGRAPSYEEYAALHSEASVPQATVQSWLATDDFRQMMRRYHEGLLWPNVSDVRLANQNARLRATAFGALNIAAQNRRTNYRGGPDVTSTALGEQCGDYEQTHFDPAFPNQFRPDPAYIQKTADGKLQEGWRLVEPFWAPGTTVKVCAFDAQETVQVTIGTRTLPCSSTDADPNRACGCGPKLAWCYAPGTAVDNRIREALREQLNRSVDDVTVGGQPYTDLLLSTRAWQNGPIAHWKRHLADHYSFGLTYNVADPEEQVLNRAFVDETWTKVERGGLHAGVLTLPGFLLRFQTNRGRANRFRSAFECEYFVPPAELPNQMGCSTTTDDLMNRCGCQYCHGTLEPLAARFGQFAEAGTTHLTDKVRFPDQSTQCKNNPNSAFCRRFYVSEQGAHRLGWLMPLQFADVHPELETAFEQGPRGRAQAIIESGTFARCTVRSVFRHLVKRDLRAQGATSDEQELLQTLADGFSQSGYSFPWLIEQVVSLPQYRRIH